MTYSTSPRAVLAAPLFLLLGACGAADPAAPLEGGEVDAPLSAYGEGVVIATVKPNEQQTIDVVEYPDGVVGIAEWHGPDFDPTTPLAMSNFAGRTLAEYYERVAGEALDATVLEKLVATSTLAGAANLEDLAAPGLPAATALETPAIKARAGLACAQDGTYYARYASGWGSAHCPAPPGWEDAWCTTNQSIPIEKNWTHGERWMIRIQNMSLCNTARIYVKQRNDESDPKIKRTLVNHDVGPNGGGMFWWEVGSRNWDWYTLFYHVSGNEQAHLNLANYRQW